MHYPTFSYSKARLRRAAQDDSIARIKLPAKAAWAVGDLVRSIKRALLTVLLNAGRTQAGKAMLVDRVLPREEFLDRQRITAARLFERKQPAAHGRNHFRLAANDPTLRPRRRQVRDRQGGTVRPDDVFDPRAMGFGHSNSHELDNTSCDITHGRLKFT